MYGLDVLQLGLASEKWRDKAMDLFESSFDSAANGNASPP